MGHKNVINYCNRPYSSVEEMNEDLLQKWNLIVNQDDTVYYLGDFSLGKDAVKEFGPKFNGLKHLICGNHDWAHPVHYKNNESKRKKFEELYLENGFISVQLEMEMQIANRKVLLHHMPYKGSGDHAENERYPEFRPINKGEWLLHGHVHTLWDLKEKMINVGCDVWNYKPVNITTIESIILERNKNKKI